MKTRIKSNQTLFRNWTLFALIVAVITGFVVFYLHRDYKSNVYKVSWIIALIVDLVCVYVLKKAIAVTQDKDGKYQTSGDLRGRHSIFIDLLGLSAVVMILSTFWRFSLLFYLAIPIYILTWVSKKTVQWLHYG